MSKKRYDVKLEKLLYRSFDEPLSDGDRKKLQTALAENNALKQEVKRIERMRSLLTDTAGAQFDPLFADRVLFRLREKEDDFLTVLLWSFRRIALVGAATIALLMVNNIITGGDLSVDSVLGLPQLTLEETLSFNHLFEGE